MHPCIPRVVRAFLGGTCAAALLSGCMAIPRAISAWQDNTTHVLELRGRSFPTELFREAVVRDGGVVTVVRPAEYVRGEFREQSAVVELRAVQPDIVRLVGSTSGRRFTRFPGGHDQVKVRTQAIAEHLQAHGFVQLDRLAPSSAVRTLSVPNLSKQSQS